MGRKGDRMTIQAIETQYKGYRFRSRLEARWAVFFDALDIPWEYEPEGFELGNGIRYLPDFWLPAQECWVEIKPRGQLYYHRQSDLLAEQTKQKVLYISGNPWAKPYSDFRESIEDGFRLEGNPSCNDWPLDYSIWLYEPADNDYDGADYFVFGLSRRNDQELNICCYSHDRVLNWIDTDDDRRAIVSHPRLLLAYCIAQQSRFEHGENGGRY